MIVFTQLNSCITFTHLNHLTHAVLMTVFMTVLVRILDLFEYNCFISLQESWVTDILMESSSGDSSNEYPNLFSYEFLYSVQATK